MRNSLELTDEKAQLKKRADEIIENCKHEIRDFNPEESSEIEAIKTKIENINEEMRNLKKSLTLNPNNNITNSNKKNMEFRLLKAIRDIANNRSLDETAKAVCNKGIEEMRKSGLSFGGQIQLPMNETRAAITVASEGEDVVATELYDILEPLRAKNVLVQSGAKFITGLVGDVQIPVMGASSVTWEGETAEASDGASTFSNVKLQPKRLTAYVDISKQFLAQDSKSAEAMIRQDLINAINSKLEATILGAEAGSTTKPAGIFYTEDEAGLTKIASFSDLCNLEASIEDANINGAPVYVMSNKAKAALRGMAKSAKSTELVMEAGQIDGTPVFNTSNVAETNLAYGDFSQLAIGQWGSLDLTCDIYTLAREGKVRLVINAFFDVKVLRPECIAVAKV